MKIEIEANCLDCQFFNDTEDDEQWCSLYRKSFRVWDENGDENPNFTKPKFCKAKSVLVQDTLSQAEEK